MDINLNNVGRGQVLSTPLGGEQILQKEQQEPLLGGESLVISEIGDFERLLHELQDEVERRQVSLAKTKISAAMAAVIGMATGLQDSQKVALEIIKAKTEALETIIKNMQVTTDERKQKLERKQELLNKKAEIEEKLKEFDKLVEATEEKADGVEQSIEVTKEKAEGVEKSVETQEEKVEVTEAGADAKEEKAVESEENVEGKEDKEKADQEVVAARTEEKTKLEQQLKAVNDELAVVESVVKDYDQEININKAKQEMVLDDIKDATAKLDKSAIGVLFAATRITAKQVLATSEKIADKMEEKEEGKDEELLALKTIDGIITKQLDKLTEDMRDEVAKKRTEMI